MSSGHRYLAFDIETATVLPDERTNWDSYRPMGICCAATLASDTGETVTWNGMDASGAVAERLSTDEAAGLVRSLAAKVAEGYTLLTWNGLGFDLDILAEESGLIAECRELALSHVDMMFHIFCDRGFPVALAKAAEALGVPGKPEGMSGVLAPKYWSEGRYDDVLSYVSDDVRITMEVARACEGAGSFRWTTRRGSVSSMSLPQGWLTVEEALGLPEPDTSWMDEPMLRSRFTGWLEQK